MSEQTPRPLRFDLSLVLYLLMIAFMAASVAWSIAQLIGWVFALPIGVALTYVFSVFAKNVTARQGTVTWKGRLLSAFFALAVFGVTTGLSYGSLYYALFAEASALSHFENGRNAVRRQLEQVIANAQTVENTFASWKQHSEEMRVLEETQGGSCPMKSWSRSVRGPIAIWRQAEAATAKSLHSESVARIAELKKQFDVVKDRKPSTFSELKVIMQDLNAAIELGESLAHGAYTRTAKESLERQLKAEIEWPKETFRCGDAARDELLERGIAALNQLAKSPALQPLSSVIDISNRQDIAGRGLIRAFNMLAKITTLGTLGTFSDDGLMQAALRVGWINRETLSFGLSALLEVCVLLTGAIAARRGQPAAPLDLSGTADLWARRTQTLPYAWQRIVSGVVLFCIHRVMNVFYVEPYADDEKGGRRAARGRATSIAADPAYPPRALQWALENLLPYWFSLHNGDYVIVPNGRNVKVAHAVRDLKHHRLAAQLSFLTEYPKLPAPAANQFERLVPDARAITYSVYKLDPDYAQALRIVVLAQPVMATSTRHTSPAATG